MSDELKARAARVIPGGMYGHESVKFLPEGFPQFFARAEGAYLWDTQGKRYLDLMCAYGPNLLGYGQADVARAAAKQAALADVATGPSPIMVDLAETFVDMVTHADWAMFCKNGSDATTMAVMAARAQTGKRIILVATGTYHGAQPWCTPLPAGTLPEDRAYLRYYTYNDVASLEQAAAEAGDDLAGVLATPFKHEAFADQQLPNPDYAHRAREICDATGAMLIIDEVRAGFRVTRDCSWSLVGVTPDLSCWGKCFANGHPISALLGSDSCRDGAGAIYVTGSFWYGAVPMAAALETLRIIRETDYLEHTITLGDHMRAGLDKAANQHGFRIKQTGPVQMPQILFDNDADFRIGFAFAREMLDRGIYLHPWHNMFLCAAMTMDDMDAVIAAAHEAFPAVRARFDSLRPQAELQALLGH